MIYRILLLGMSFSSIDIKPNIVVDNFSLVVLHQFPTLFLCDELKFDFLLSLHTLRTEMILAFN